MDSACMTILMVLYYNAICLNLLSQVGSLKSDGDTLMYTGKHTFMKHFFQHRFIKSFMYQGAYIHACRKKSFSQRTCISVD